MQRTIIDVLNIISNAGLIPAGAIFEVKDKLLAVSLKCDCTMHIQLTDNDRDGLSDATRKVVESQCEAHNKPITEADLRLTDEMIEDALESIFGSARMDKVRAGHAEHEKNKQAAKEALAPKAAAPEADSQTATAQESLMGEYLSRLLLAAGVSQEELAGRGVHDAVTKAIENVLGYKKDLEYKNQELAAQRSLIYTARKATKDAVNILNGVI